MQKNLRSLETLRLQAESLNQVYKPEFYRLSDPAQRESFYRLLETPGLSVVDRIRDQVKELIKSRTPDQRFSTNELEEQINLELGQDEEVFYGVWVYYPWSKRLVHLLNKDDFIQVRTSRNQYKITPAERDVLAGKKIGVIGLSVGQSVSVTLIMERICGEIRLADFDLLELTNLNRIRTGVHNLGLPKVYSVAREISEIDPFIEVKCFPEGLHENNLDDFFLNGGKLDLVVEESDGFDIKVLSRLKARQFKVPVLMEASDRCMVDVERFDREPQRSLLHGLMDDLDVELLKTLQTNEQKIPYMLDILGIETSSARLKASMLEMGRSISTWPQLASAVTMGGGITADVARRVLLDQFTSSGRYYVDVEQLIGDGVEKAKVTSPSFVPLQLTDLPKNLDRYRNDGLLLDEQSVRKIVEAGCQAPSASNNQPWLWLYRKNELLLFNAWHGDEGLVGYKNMAPHLALGAAALNVTLAAAELGLEAQINWNPNAARTEPVAVFTFLKTTSKKGQEEKLATAINSRCTNRNLGERISISSAVLEQLQASIEADHDFSLRFITDEGQLHDVGKLIGELEKVRLLDPQAHREFVSEIRWTEKEAEQKRDGIDLRTFSLSNIEKAGLSVARDPKVVSLLKEWDLGSSLSSMAYNAVMSAGAVGILSTSSDSQDKFLKAGVAMQRLWLKATLLKIGIQPMAAPVFMFAPLGQPAVKCLGKESLQKLEQLKPQFRKLFDLKDAESELFIFRAAMVSPPSVRSLRKELDKVFVYQS